MVHKRQLFHCVTYNNVKVQFHISPIPDDDIVMNTVATWSISQWGSDFLEDTIDTYVNLYRMSVTSTTGIPRVFIASNTANDPIATITFVANDDLPDASEPGPWLAALFVLPEHRHQGIGGALVNTVVDHARSLGHTQLYLYTADQVKWYEDMGWLPLRKARLSNYFVTVMSRVV